MPGSVLYLTLTLTSLKKYPRYQIYMSSQTLVVISFIHCKQKFLLLQFTPPLPVNPFTRKTI